VAPSTRAAPTAPTSPRPRRPIRRSPRELVYSTDNPEPSYLGGDPYLAALGDPGINQYVAGPEALPSGDYYLRVQVIRATDLGRFLVAQTDVATYTVP
jgi:hypothetical protein